MSTFSSRIRIGELVEQYRHHPHTRDLWVEGNRDVSFYRWVSRQCNARDIQVKAIDLVDVPSNLVARLGLLTGEKSEVLTLADELERRLPAGDFNVRCVVDLDDDALRGGRRTGRMLRYTTGSMIELYAWSPETLQKFFDLNLEGIDLDPHDVIARAEPILHKVFVFRSAIQQLQLGVGPLPLGKRIKIGSDGIPDFGFPDYIHDSLSKNAQQRRTEEVLEKCNELLSLISGDGRQFIHKVDMSEALVSFIRPHLRKSLRKVYSDPEQVCNAIIGCIDVKLIISDPLIADLMHIWK